MGSKYEVGQWVRIATNCEEIAKKRHHSIGSRSKGFYQRHGGRTGIVQGVTGCYFEKKVGGKVTFVNGHIYSLISPKGKRIIGAGFAWREYYLRKVTPPCPFVCPHNIKGKCAVKKEKTCEVFIDYSGGNA